MAIIFFFSVADTSKTTKVSMGNLDTFLLSVIIANGIYVVHYLFQFSEGNYASQTGGSGGNL